MLKRHATAVPAIDLLDGRVVRLRQGRYDEVTEYEADPLDLAAEYAAEGATLLHVIDLSAARDGRRPKRHAELIGRLVHESGLAVQVGGGIRSLDDVEEALDLGVARVLVGTLAVEEPGAVGRIAGRTARVAAACDVRDGTVRAAGWTADSRLAAREFIKRLTGAGVRDILVTAIDRDGTGSGPDTALLRSLRPAVPGILLAAGGIGSVADVVAAADAGADAVVIGRALYEGAVRLSEASASLRSSPNDSPS